MKLIVDTNIINAGLVKEADTRRLLIHPELELYTPEFTIFEIEKHKDILQIKSGLSRKDFTLLSEGIISRITVVPIESFRRKLSKAYKIMEQIDIHDTPFLALALSFDNDGIWSHDKDFCKQDLVRVWSTKELLEIFE